ncbi:ester cyclase [Fulvivirgaceae bacterium PWU4]|uniref:Ester cyclase n=1 Tax=Chryseosolibacter histidini TaxID=2782349 RepID=A0AAP2GHM0_9BACT|nr:ester cyclase [Chryseosolibacter histidini]MBT1696204.1 ester cyclase [Chryseosolibacter histidini]
MRPVHLLLAVLLIPGASHAQATSNSNKSTKNKEVIMSDIQRNKEAIGNLYERVLNKKDMKLLPQFVSEDYIATSGKKGAVAFEEPLTPLFRAFPDAHWKIEEMISEADKVIVKYKFFGTHTGQLQHFAITGKSITTDGIGIFQLKDGKIVSSQVHTDRLGFLQQLEALPTDLTLLSNRKAGKDQVQFIDKFFIPAAAKQAFYERMHINRDFIKKLPGFIEDAAYEYTDNDGNLICVTVALWENREALNKAREAVQAEYKKQGFDAAEMFQRLNIKADRGIYTEVEER